MTDQRWDRFFLGIAKQCASMSKDGSTQVGAVVVRPNKTIASTGWNGFARGLSDAPDRYADRDFKIATVIHAEENSILTAREPLDGYTIYISGLPPCAHCASMIIQSGIKTVVYPKTEVPERWRQNMDWSLGNLREAGVTVREVNL